MLTNDIASLIQTEDKVTIVLNELYRMRGLELDELDEMVILSIYSGYIREKLKEKTNE